MTHSESRIKWIDEELKRKGIDNYRFCAENDCYVCDINGNFYSVCTRQKSKAGKLIERYEIKKLNGSKDRYGYLTYRICVDGIKKHLKAHRMMLAAWDVNHPDLVVNHIDGNKENNSLKNLEWCTVAENNEHAIKTGLFNPRFQKGRLKKIPSCDWMPIYILYKHAGYSYSALGRIYHCTHETIKRIIEKLDGIFPEEIKNAG